MSDLVERLRFHRAWNDSLTIEAADRIEELEAKVAALEVQVAELKRKLKKLGYAV